MPEIKRRSRLRLRYGYVLALIFALGVIGGTVAVIKNDGRVPDADAATIARPR